MTVRVYRSTDANAPILNGLQGSLVHLLDTCLVTGYGTKASSGWTKPFIDTNKAVFKQGSGSNGRYLLIDDSSNDQFSKITAFENMTSITVGTGQMPLPLQNNGFLYHPRSDSFDNTTRDWTIIATEKMFYLYTIPNVSFLSYVGGNTTCFGDINSTLLTDTYNTVLIGNSGLSTNGNSGYLKTLSSLSIGSSSSISGHYISRGYTQLGSSIPMGKISDYSKSGYTEIGSSSTGNNMPFPNPTDGKIYIAPVYITENSNGIVGIIRGTLPGLWCSLCSGSYFNQGDVITNLHGATAGTTLEVFKHNTGIFLFETSNTW